MSLVAAAKIDDLPFLIGDCMVSRPGKPNSRTLRRKIVRLSRNLVVGKIRYCIGALDFSRSYTVESLPFCESLFIPSLNYIKFLRHI